MINNTFCVGVGGLATTGKDTFCNLLLKRLSKNGILGKRFALADDLKSSRRQYLLDTYGIDVLNCTAKEKEIIRPDLVAYGKEKRIQSNGTYWTNLLEEKIKNFPEVQVAIIPDIRYALYPEDEHYWIRNKTGGLLVHVARYDIVDGTKIWFKPPNEDEAENDPLIRSCADFSLSWESLDEHNLMIRYEGFLTTLVSCIYVEIDRQRRLATC